MLFLILWRVFPKGKVLLSLIKAISPFCVLKLIGNKICKFVITVGFIALHDQIVDGDPMVHEFPCWSELVFAGLRISGVKLVWTWAHFVWSLHIFDTFQLFKKHVCDIGTSGIRCSTEVLFSSTAGSSLGASKEQIVCMVKVTEDDCEEWKRSFKCSAITDVLSCQEGGGEDREQETVRMTLYPTVRAIFGTLYLCVLPFSNFFHYTLFWSLRGKWNSARPGHRSY